MKRYLITEDGAVIVGSGYGSPVTGYGELVFTTSMTGYLESLTDPSYVGQILVFASPTISNYELHKGVMESERVKVSGVITRDAHMELPAGPLGGDFDRFLRDEGIPAIDGVDTRFIVRKIRQGGVLKAYITDDPEAVNDFPDPMNENLVTKALDSTGIRNIKGGSEERILFIDLGSKKTLRDMMLNYFSLTVASPDSDLDSIDHYDAIFVSNGPGDPQHPSLKPVVEFIRKNLGRKPVFGICFGLQIIALAYGSKTYKMKFGHRGSNHAVSDGRRVFITTHNHGYAVDPDTIRDFHVTERDVNDGTVEMIEDEMMMAVQYHPEASPGPHDTRWFFSEMRRRTDAAKR
ncbi:carbamoyl-phosphate synthase small subunit [Thermoplasma sp. Kam2015]|uniref:glutamine-hydrolyzing carbamoyl-phosphate synthase small subunit n=1 Tax=Thermoplasma sp. Kam2015 TaxID=2094122 RepID=UPI000D8EE7CE|nr:glutamine-hydrolyzing carbamoyl-phosphate synthase small subunit [Thermoplasma sp. Kam2015]PYB68523.1 carbamoyl-phosphate synthase small subunit [Thermoplasma sp. Kam2015]